MSLHTHSLDDALKELKFGKFNIYLMAIVGAVLSCTFIETTSVNLVLPIAQCELKLSNLDKGLLGAMGYVGIILSSHLWGFLADTRGRKKVMVLTLLMSFVFSFISSLSKSFEMMVVMRFFVGFFISASQSTGYAYLGEFHSSKDRARALMITSAFYGLFAYILPFNGYFFINQDWEYHISFLDLNFTPWRLYIIMNGLMSVLSGLLLAFFIPESPKFEFLQGNDEKTLKILKKIYKINSGNSEESFNVKSISREGEETARVRDANFFKFIYQQTKPLFQKSHLRNLLTASYLQFGFCLTCNGFWTFFPETLNKVYLWMDTNSSSQLTICEVFNDFKISPIDEEICIKKLESGTFINIVILETIFFFGWLAVSFFINRVGKLVCLLVVSIPCAVCAILLIFVKSPLVGVYLYLVMIAVGMNIATINTSTVELFPTSMRAMAVSISLMTGRIGSIIGSNVIGVMIKSYCQYTWLIPAILLLSGSALMFTIPNISKINK